jgi:hypothetical protein
MDTKYFRVKRIRFQNRTTPIILQNVNGPCPLLAISNVLLLRGRFELPPDIGMYTRRSCVGSNVPYKKSEIC